MVGFAALRTWGKRSGRGIKADRRMDLLKRAGLFENNTHGAKIFRATTLDDLIEAYRLTHDVFVRQGYILPDETGIRVRPFEALPDTATFIAKAGEEVVGVTSVVIDNPELGLPTDKAFKAEVGLLRRRGRKICEGTNWLVADSHRNSAVMTELMRCCFAHARAAGCTDFIGAVSPGHAKFYKLLGFEQVGDVRSYSEEIEDPVVVVRFDLSALSKVLEDIMDGQDETELFLKRYYVDDNPYMRYVRTWQILSDRFFVDPRLLVELFVYRSGLLERCGWSELEAIRLQWGDKLFVEVMSHSLEYAASV
ncbi:MAG: GNAT family N-acetyltransferase [Planctomycetota bacterium]|nr:GNAT family N-acetyltransferase [Planctomycetota bacterium]